MAEEKIPTVQDEKKLQALRMATEKIEKTFGKAGALGT